MLTNADILAALDRRKHNLFSSLFPDIGPLRRDLYARHTDFFTAGAIQRVRLFRAANRAGKTIAGGYETACHLTGNYPSWWTGRRFTKPGNWIVASETGKLTRDGVQYKLMGPPAEIGTGIIPKDLIGETRAKSGIPDAFDTVRIKHSSGGWSTLQFQSYDQGREAFQATDRDGIWLDEEPPLAIYTEALTRTMTTKGIVMLTFTPLKGMSETVMFMEQQCRDGNAVMITATWDDAPHLDEDDKTEMMKAYPPHQRDARTKGIPSLGAGAIYPVPESDFVVEPFVIPKHWKHVYGMDVGWNNTAAVFAAVDPDSGIAYIASDYKRGQAEPSIHAAAVKQRARGDKKPGVIDPASKGRSQHDGQQLLTLYRGQGLNLQEADNGVESGLYEVWQMLSTGKLKVFSTCQALLDEYRVYRRNEKGQVVKDNDHIMDALRYLCVSGIVLARPEIPTTKKINLNNSAGTWASA